jgi:Flp pilus assembly protein TadG
MAHIDQVRDPIGALLAVTQAKSRMKGSGHGFRTKRQHGAIAIMFAVMLLIVFGFFGLAIDLAMLYNRKIEMQSVADAAAMAAARQLNGTPAGVSNALLRAAQAAEGLNYQHNRTGVTWSNAAIRFGNSASADGEWLELNAGSANAATVGIRYARVDTSELDPEHGMVNTLFIKMLGGAQTVNTSGRAIAGPTGINVTPLAICAMSTNPAEGRANPASNVPPPLSAANIELVQYGFRRGVSYDLMRLNPKDSSVPANFLVNPIAPPGTVGTLADTTDTIAGPFVCTGTMAMTHVTTGGAITISAGLFPIGTLFNHLNSRFDDYTTNDCDANAAPPDANIRSYDYNMVPPVPTRIPWMSVVPNFQRAKEYANTVNPAAKRLESVADPVGGPVPAVAPAVAAKDYGVLWSYARAVPYSSYTPGDEPAAGYAPAFGVNAWATLYAPGKPTASASYPAGLVNTPYKATLGSTNFQQPTVDHLPGIRNRRVLNIPLLACPVGASSAMVLGIGRFFMTVPATPTAIYAEFAGIVSENALTTEVKVFP